MNDVRKVEDLVDVLETPGPERAIEGSDVAARGGAVSKRRRNFEKEAAKAANCLLSQTSNVVIRRSKKSRT